VAYEFEFLVSEVCSRIGVLFRSESPLDVALASPFIVPKGRARVTFAVKRRNGEKTKEKNKKGGIGHGRLSPYPV
jgi:hypothetical protein